MTPDMLDLARRAVASPHWRWLRGMGVRSVLADGSIEDATGVVVHFMDTLPVVWWPDLNSRRVHLPQHLLPDLAEQATFGYLLALVREAWGAPRALVRLSANGKSFHVFDVDRVTMGGNWAAFLCGDRILQTEVEALVRALEAAPVVTP